jgi:hypothetical protein
VGDRIDREIGLTGNYVIPPHGSRAVSMPMHLRPSGCRPGSKLITRFSSVRPSWNRIAQRSRMVIDISSLRVCIQANEPCHMTRLSQHKGHDWECGAPYLLWRGSPLASPNSLLIGSNHRAVLGKYPPSRCRDRVLFRLRNRIRIPRLAALGN